MCANGRAGGGTRVARKAGRMSASLSEFELTGESDAVPRARQLVRETLAEAPGEQRDDVELVVAELVTNAVLHGAAPVTLRLRLDPVVVRVEVHDTGRQRPIAMPGGVDAMTGRGLALVAALSREWGVEPTPDGGKVVWAQVPAEGTEVAAAARFDDSELDAFL